MLPSCSQCSHRAHGDEPCTALTGGYGVDPVPCRCGQIESFHHFLNILVDPYVPDDRVVVVSVDPVSGKVDAAMVLL